MTINDVVSAYIKAKEAEKEAKKTADAMKSLILEKAGSDPLFETDAYSVFIKRTESTRLDSDALYRDFPDIKQAYGRTSVSCSIVIADKASEQKTA